MVHIISSAVKERKGGRGSWTQAKYFVRGEEAQKGGKSNKASHMGKSPP